jgi:hypothetical protein
VGWSSHSPVIIRGEGKIGIAGHVSNTKEEGARKEKGDKTIRVLSPYAQDTDVPSLLSEMA